MEDFDAKRESIMMLKDSGLFTEKELDFLITWQTMLPGWGFTNVPSWAPSKAGEVLGNRSTNNIQQWCKTMGVSKDLTGQFWMITAPDLIRMKEKANKLDSK